MSLKIERRRSPIHGNGVFATGSIKKGEHIVEYKGKLITHEQADNEHYGDLNTGHTFLFTLNEHWIIDASKRGNVAKWINCSCEPNSAAYVHESADGDPKKEKVIIEAKRTIRPGEEITYDYGFEFDVPYTKKLMRIWACHCGSPKCRGTMLKGKGRVKKARRSAKKVAKRAGR